MLETIWQRLAGGPRGEPEVVDLARLPELIPPVLRRLSRELTLIATPAADPRAFYDAPALRHLSPVLRVGVCNALALDVHEACPPYHARRREGRDLLFCSFAARGAPPLRVEVEFTPDGLRGPPGTAYPPEAALDLDGLLRRADFWALPATAGATSHDGDLWHLSVVLGGRQHVLRRCSPKGAERDLLQGVLLALGIDVAALRRGRTPGRAAPTPPAVCTWTPCTARPLPDDPSYLCVEHRARIDAQGENLQRRRR